MQLQQDVPPSKCRREEVFSSFWLGTGKDRQTDRQICVCKRDEGEDALSGFGWDGVNEVGKKENKKKKSV